MKMTPYEIMMLLIAVMMLLMAYDSIESADQDNIQPPTIVEPMQYEMVQFDQG